MSTSSLLGIGPDNIPAEHRSTGIDSLGPSDASDSGSDSAGAYSNDSDTDRSGTGERSSVEPTPAPGNADILPDHVEQLAGNTDDAQLRRRGALSAEGLPHELPQNLDENQNT